jgi:hypothetical protein
MSSNTIIQAVEIKLGAEYTEDATLGLYTVAGTSYLRWSEAALTGVAESWADKIILKNGIGDIAATSDLSRGGNVAEYSGLNVIVANAESLMQSLKDLGINLIGLSATITEFVGIIGNSDSVSRTIFFTGIVENISWGDTDLTIALKNSLYKRETNLSRTNADGITTPVIFGNHYPPATKVIDGVAVASDTINNLAKFVRTIDTYDDKTYTNEYFTGTFPLIKIFPITTIGTTEYFIETNGNVTLTATTPEDTYVLIINGTDAKGQIRQVMEFTPSGSPDNHIAFSIKDVFLKELSAINDDTRTWVQFIKIGRNYNIDSWPCKNFLRAEDGSITLIPELYSYDSAMNKFARIADFGFTIKDSNNNALDIDGSQYTDDIDSVDSFIAYPIKSLSLETDEDLFNWDGFHTELKIADGVYSATAGIECTANSFINSERAYDKISTNYADHTSEVDLHQIFNEWIHFYRFELPTIPFNAAYNKFYLGIKLGVNYASDYGTHLTSVDIFFRRFAYTKTTDNLALHRVTTNGGTIIDDIPDAYYSDSVSTNNLNYYKEHPLNGVNSYEQLTGYTFFELTGITSIEEYSTLILGGLYLHRSALLMEASPPVAFQTKIYEMCIICKLDKQSIKKEIFSPLGGRIYDDTWGSRKTQTNQIDAIGDIIEHCNRLKNWTEIPGHTVVNWGHAYSPDALIKTSGSGSFDSANLNYLTNQKAAIEIIEESQATTTAIIKKLCDSFGLCSYIDENGYECVETLELINPSETITLTDQIGAIGDVDEPEIQNIFCEPVVNYLYNLGSEKFDAVLKVTNIDAASWLAAYTPGYTLADGEIVWNLCKALYTKYRQVETCPSEFSDQNCIADYATAVLYVKRKIAWMDKQRLPTITVAYSKGKNYNIYKHIKVQLPMHTDNESKECIIENITKSKNNGTVSIDFVKLE